MKNTLAIFLVIILTSAIAMGDLAGYWKFDEGSGLNAADSSTHGKNGVLYAANDYNYPQWITGHDGNGNALLFNAGTTGSSNWNHVLVDITTSDALASLRRAFTISMWVRRDTVDYLSWPRLVDTDAYDVELALDPCGTGDWDPYDYFWSDTNTPWELWIGVENDAQKTLGSWYHLAIVSDGQKVKKYVNGVVEFSGNAPGGYLPVATTDLVIGSQTDGDAYFTGALDDVAIWAGKYLAAGEIAKLAAGTATPLTVVESNELVPLSYYMETPLYAGWSALWQPDMIGMTSVINNQVVYNTSWIFPEPGSRQDIVPFNWYVKNETDYNDAPVDISKHGVEWIEQYWNGREPNMTVIAAYITPGLIFGQKDWGYQLYNPGGAHPEYEDKPYFKTNLRIASINSNGASVRTTVYSLSSDVVPNGSNYSTLLTKLGEIVCPLDAGDRVWRHLVFVLPKPQSSARIPLWFETVIVGGDANTVLYIDNFKPASEQYVTFKGIDLNKDSYISYKDIYLLTYNWLDHTDATVIDPRNGGLLTNGDFTADNILLGADDDARVRANPTGWSITGSGDYGIVKVAKRGWMNYWGNQAIITPMGGNVAAYTTDMEPNDPNGVLTQTAGNAVAGQTYYAMAYVLGTHPTNSWWAWKDKATLNIDINGVNVLDANRPMSRNIWRPVYGKYTATGADNGKPIKMKLSYANTHTLEDPNAGYMTVGYTYLGTTMPDEWPEKRPNLLVNGGFEDLSALDANIPDGIARIAEGIRKSDNWGGWFIADVPTPPNWVYEVPSGYNLANKGGVWASGFYATPLPTPGMSDVAIYASNTLTLGQVIGALTPGTTYYLDMSCGINNSNYINDVNWPNPAPVFHIELWKIPAGVTNGTTIYNQINAGDPNYVKRTEAAVSATGNVAGSSTTRGTPASKWQLIGTTYTAISADTSMYVRVRGSGGVAANPEYAFNDVYLSTQKRLVPGGSITFNASAGMLYDTLGPYNCYHAGLMGYTAPSVDFDGNCITNFVDFAMMAAEWLKVGIAL